LYRARRQVASVKAHFDWPSPISAPPPPVTLPAVAFLGRTSGRTTRTLIRPRSGQCRGSRKRAPRPGSYRRLASTLADKRIGVIHLDGAVQVQLDCADEFVRGIEYADIDHDTLTHAGVGEPFRNLQGFPV